MKNAKGDYVKPLKLFSIMFMLFLLASCSSNIKEEIIGEWREIDGSEIMELSNDNSISLVSRYMRINGSYEFVGKDKISVEFNTLGPLEEPFLAQVSVKDDQLTWIMPDGKVSIYKREQ